MSLIKNHNHNAIYTLIMILIGVILILGVLQLDAVKRIQTLEFEIQVINARLDMR